MLTSAPRPGTRLRQLGLIHVVLITMWTASLSAQTAPRPNILFIYTDDQAAWTLGSYGNKQAHTPHLDRLAAEGARLTQALVATPVCSPARASLFSSRYGTEVGILDFIPHPGHKEFTPETGAIGLPHAFTAFPQLLSSAGYATALVGKWHVGDWTKDPDRTFHPTRFGFEYFMGLTGGGISTENPILEKEGQERRFTGLTDDILTDDAISYLENHRSTRPFFLFLGLRAPHTAYLPVAPEDAAPYAEMEMDIPNPDYPDLNVANVKKMMKEYLSSVTSIDRNVGRLLATLERRQLAANTIVIFTSDHGYNMGHNGIWHKGNGIWATTTLPPASPRISARYRPNLYDYSLRVPALVKWPGKIPAGLVVSNTVSNLDWYPTLLAMAGVTPPPSLLLRGRDASLLLRGEAPADWNDDFYAEYSMRIYAQTDLRAYRTQRWKLVRDYLNPERDELYDLRDDPEESKNLFLSPQSAEARAAVAMLDQHLREKRAQIHDPVIR